MHSVLTTAAAAGLESTAISLIGSGNAGWAVKLAAEAHIEGVLQFAKASSTATSLKVAMAFWLLTSYVKLCLKSDKPIGELPCTACDFSLLSQSVVT